jgi:hypothetical protein
VTSGIRRETEEVLKKSNPDAFILITNSSNQVIDSEDTRLILTEQISIENIQAGATFRFQGKEISFDNFVIVNKKGVVPKPLKAKTGMPLLFIPKTKFTFSYLVQNSLGLLITVALLICIISVLLYRLALGISKNIQEFEMSIEVLATGSLVDINDSPLENELGTMVCTLKKLIVGLRSTANFAKQIGQGELLADFKPMGEHDTIGNSLLTMRQSLAKIREEDEQRTWAAQGIAKMGDIL